MKKRTKRRNPNTPTGYPTAADAEHTAKVEAIKARREAEYLRERERRAALTPEELEREFGSPAQRRVVRELVLLAAASGGLGPARGGQ